MSLVRRYRKPLFIYCVILAAIVLLRWITAPSYIWPVEGNLGSQFGEIRGLTKRHQGIDILAGNGSPIKAIDKGTVLFAGRRGDFGLTVIVQHSRYKGLYSHCSQILVTRGSSVEQGQTLAFVGKSGNATNYHLHFELRNSKDEPVDPNLVLPMR